MVITLEAHRGLSAFHSLMSRPCLLEKNGSLL